MYTTGCHRSFSAMVCVKTVPCPAMDSVRTAVTTAALKPADHFNTNGTHAREPARETTSRAMDGAIWAMSVMACASGKHCVS